MTRKPEENLEIIKKLLAVLLLKNGLNVKQVAKISEMSDKTLTELYPKSKMKKSKNNKDNNEK
ncbi:MAG: hypothetical protein KGI27_02240 [Thaumarchaeota archaeon]|nr:hypothetical protein [Nitrososphaerota archaeon]